MMRVFIDADIILDLLLDREPFSAGANRFFSLVQAREIEGFVSPLIFSNLFYILRKKSSGPEALVALRKLRLLTQILPVGETTIDQALASSFTDFEDAIQYYAAQTEALDAIVTRNKQDYRPAKLPILTAEECIQVFFSSRG